jgi:hypothetical protein
VRVKNVRVTVRGHTYKVVVLDDGLDTDPTFLLFRDDEEEAIATVHLDPKAMCTDIGHVIAREVE